MKTQNMVLAVIPVLLAIAVTPFAANTVFAQDANTDVASDRVPSISPNTVNAVPIDVAPDRKAEVKFRGGTDGWAIIGGEAFTSKIGIEGKAAHQGNGVWKVISDAEITAAERHATLELKGKAADGKIRLHGTGTLDSGESFRIFLRGHFTPVFDEPGSFVMAFTAAKIHSAQNGITIPLIQDGIVNVEPMNSNTVDYEEFLKSFE